MQLLTQRLEISLCGQAALLLSINVLLILIANEIPQLHRVIIMGDAGMHMHMHMYTMCMHIMGDAGEPLRCTHGTWQCMNMHVIIRTFGAQA